jgi:uncharacterized protein (DUF58 family)
MSPAEAARGRVLADPHLLARVRRLHLLARVVSDALLVGGHRSRRTGQAVEFADYQEYAPGMDPRGVDWKVWARTDRLVVKRYETETQLPCTLVLDLSADLATGRAPAGVSSAGVLPALEGTKAGFAITLAATAATWLHRQGEPVGLEIVGAEGGPVSLPPRGSTRHLQHLLLALAGARPGGAAGLAEAFARVAHRTRRRSLVLIVSDGMEEPSKWLPALRAFGARGADLRFLHVFDAAELRLELPGSVLLFSPEGGDALPIDPSGARAGMVQVAGAWMREVRAGVLAAGGQYVAAPVDADRAGVIARVARAVSTSVDARFAEGEGA